MSGAGAMRQTSIRAGGLIFVCPLVIRVRCELGRPILRQSNKDLNPGKRRIGDFLHSTRVRGACVCFHTVMRLLFDLDQYVVPPRVPFFAN